MQQIILIHSLTLALISFTSYTMPGIVQASYATSQLSDNSQVQFNTQPQLPDNGSPTGRRKGAAGRGNCILNPPLTALVPTVEKNLHNRTGKVTYVWGKTLAEYPTFWFYVPYSPTALRSVEFVLQQEEEDVYRTLVFLPNKPGVVSFRLPSTAKPLELNKMYHWFFKVKLDCDNQTSYNHTDYVEGWVQRVKLNQNFTNKLATATPEQRIALYANNDIWHDALTMLADLRLTNTEDATLKRNWTNLLQSIGLSDITSKPLVECCLSSSK